jgi:hypothetical protein
MPASTVQTHAKATARARRRVFEKNIHTEKGRRGRGR